MMISRTTFRTLAALFAFGVSLGWAQETQPSLGDVARKTRKEHSSAGHVPAKQVTDEEEDGPDAGNVWRVRQCSAVVCYTLSVALPKAPRWIRPDAEPRPVLIPLAGYEEDLTHAIRVYAAESLKTTYASVDLAKKTFLQAWFTRPEYFGAPARLINDERIPATNGEMKITHFAITSGITKFRGLSVIAPSPLNDYGFACVYREEDSAAASSICDAIIRSAHDQTFLTAQKRVSPTYAEPPVYYPRADDPPDEEDPE